IAGLRIVIAHQASKLDSRGSEVTYLQRRVGRQFSLNPQRPLPNIGRPLLELIDQNKSGGAGTLERTIEAQIGPERFGRLIAPDCEWSVANDIEYGIADVAYVINSASGPQYCLRRDRVRKAKAWSEIVQVVDVGSPAESAVAHIFNVGREAERGIALVRISR